MSTNVNIVVNHIPKQEVWRHISTVHTVHEGHKDYKCEDYGKSFTAAQTQQRHIHIVHGGHKDHKCESCGKSFS